MFDFSDSPAKEHRDFLWKIRDRFNFFIETEVFNCSHPDERNIGYFLEANCFNDYLIHNFKIHRESILENFRFVFVNDRRVTKLDDKIKWGPASFCWIEEPSIREKKSLVSIISSAKVMTSGHRKRLEYVDRYKDKADLFGVGFNQIEKKEIGLDDYMFSLAIENDEYSGYFTEKILDCFATGTVPLYIGDPDIGSVFNPDGIIVIDESFDIDSLNEDMYYERIDAIKDNFERCKEFYSIQDYIYETYLREIDE